MPCTVNGRIPPPLEQRTGFYQWGRISISGAGALFAIIQKKCRWYEEKWADGLLLTLFRQGRAFPMEDMEPMSESVSDPGSHDKDGRLLLQQPVLPLVRLVQLLYLTGPFDTMTEVLAELIEPIETGGVIYVDPAALLGPYLTTLRLFERVKNGVVDPPLPRILNDDLEPVDSMTALDSWIGQQVLIRELERINSLLCGPCGCTLCCTGPGHGSADPAEQDSERLFFEIPLAAGEIELFNLEQIDTDNTRVATAMREPALLRGGRPFYLTGPALYCWQSGWSLILPRHGRCPHLDPEFGGCRIYLERPEVCRRPQVFPYLLERRPDLDQTIEDSRAANYVIRRKLLAVWDCPYVRQDQDLIAAYAEMCDLEPVFRENKG